MGMRASDARWLRRNVMPFLEDALPGMAGDTYRRALELMAEINKRAEEPEQPTTLLRFLGCGRRNPSVAVYQAVYDDQPVPHVEVACWPCTWENGYPRQAYPTVTLETNGGNYDFTVTWDGDYCWTVMVDDRFAFDFEHREDVERLIPPLATGMAIAAGFTSHGLHSFPANRHGPAVGLAPIPQLGDPDRTLGH